MGQKYPKGKISNIITWNNCTIAENGKSNKWFALGISKTVKNRDKRNNFYILI